MTSRFTPFVDSAGGGDGGPGLPRLSRDIVAAFLRCLRMAGVLPPKRLETVLQSLAQSMEDREAAELALVDARTLMLGAGFGVLAKQPRWQVRADTEDASAPWGSLWLGWDQGGWQLWRRSAESGWFRCDTTSAPASAYPAPNAQGYLFSLMPESSHAMLLEHGSAAGSSAAQANAELPREGESSYWHWVIALLRGRVLWISAASFLVNLGMVTLPLFAMLVYDKVVFNGIFETLWALAFGVVLFMMVEISIRVFRARQIERLAQVLDERVDRQLFSSLLRPANRAGSHPGMAARFLTLYRDLAGARDFFSATYLLALADLPFVLMMWVIIGLIAWPLLLVAVLWTGVYVWLGGIVKARTMQASRAVLKVQVAKQAVLTDALSSLDILRTSHAGGVLFQKFMELARIQSGNSAWLRDENGFQAYLTQIVYSASYVSLIICGAYLVFDQQLTVGALVAVSMLSGRTLGVISGALLTLGRWNELQQALKSLTPFLKGDTAASVAVRRALSMVDGRLSVHRVQHVYGGGEHVLTDLDLNIEAGERVALLGRPGSGKSTLARLMAGAIVPTEGEIRIDNVALTAFDISDRAQWLAFKPQEVSLVEGTLEENILIGIPSWASDAERMAALKRGLYLSGLDQDLQRGDMSLSQSVEEYGANLSGGQRQKVALARALAVPAKILILDEPSNGLDPESEKILVARLSELKNMTLIVVTHSANLLSLTKRVIALDKGRILADGLTAELIKAPQH